MFRKLFKKDKPRFVDTHLWAQEDHDWDIFDFHSVRVEVINHAKDDESFSGYRHDLSTASYLVRNVENDMYYYPSNWEFVEIIIYRRDIKDRYKWNKVVELVYDNGTYDYMEFDYYTGKKMW